jgi:hypothetical protein
MLALALPLPLSLELAALPRRPAYYLLLNKEEQLTLVHKVSF